jgi:hypothetical protein
VAGTSSMRTTVASSSTALARPTPNSLMMRSLSPMKDGMERQPIETHYQELS